MRSITISCNMSINFITLQRHIRLTREPSQTFKRHRQQKNNRRINIFTHRTPTFPHISRTKRLRTPLFMIHTTPSRAHVPALEGGACYVTAALVIRQLSTFRRSPSSSSAESSAYLSWTFFGSDPHSNLDARSSELCTIMVFFDANSYLIFCLILVYVHLCDECALMFGILLSFRSRFDTILTR